MAVASIREPVDAHDKAERNSRDSAKLFKDEILQRILNGETVEPARKFTGLMRLKADQTKGLTGRKLARLRSDLCVDHFDVRVFGVLWQYWSGSWSILRHFSSINNSDLSSRNSTKRSCIGRSVSWLGLSSG